MEKVLKEIFIDSQIIGALVGFGASYFISVKIQRNIWKKEFDKYQTEPFIEIFRYILLTLQDNSVATIKNGISKEYLDKLKVEILLVRYFDENLKNEININIYQECLSYNNIGIIKNSTQLSSTEVEKTNIIANEGRVEREKREKIERTISDIMDKIKVFYSKI